MGLGWNHTLLRVNLSNGEIRKETIPQRLLEQYIGGEGLAARILYDTTGPDTDPLGPPCPLILAVGPLTGTAIGGGRISLVTKSCLTGLMVCGNMGGHFAPALKYAGYDILLIIGQSPSPVYLFIDDGRVEIRDASKLWGKDTWETDEALESECGPGFQKQYIGPAGERLVVNADVVGNRYHSGGRYGFGVAMGAKRLKAVVVKGTGGVGLADPPEFLRALDEIWAITDPKTAATAATNGLYGSALSVSRYQANGAIPTRNFTQGEFEGIRQCSSDTLLRKHYVKARACFGCRLPACEHWTEVKGGPDNSLAYEGPMAGTLDGPGTMLGIADPSAQMQIQVLCNRLGVCMLGISFLIAWAMEAFERGDLTKEDADGLELHWGEPEAVLELVRRIAYREGPFADLLAAGLAKAAQKIGRGTEDYALTIKGQEMTPVSPTAFLHMGLAYATNDRGPIHTHYGRLVPLTSVDPEIREILDFDFAQAANRSSPADKGRFVKWLADSTVVVNSLIYCAFLTAGTVAVDLRPFARALTSATGTQFTHDSLMKMGERVLNLERAYAVGMGLTRRDDRIPKRFLEEGFPTGGSAGVIVPLEQMLDQYYAARGWDLETGIPTSTKLQQLGLASESDDLQPARERERTRPNLKMELAERQARRAGQDVLYQRRMSEIAARTAQAMAQTPGEFKRLKIRYVGSVCVAAGGVQEEDVWTKVNTVQELLTEIRSRHPEVYALLLDPVGEKPDSRRTIMSLVPGGLTRVAPLAAPLCNDMIVTFL